MHWAIKYSVVKLTLLLRGVIPAAAILAIACAASAQTEEEIGYNLEFMTTWSSCDCSAPSLSYTDNQINMLDSTLRRLGHEHLSKFSNTLVWASDLSEDVLGGEDNLYSDNGQFYAYSGHGGAPVVAGAQTFRAPFCHVGTSALQRAGGTCNFSAEFARMGELSGPFANPNPGQLRWLLWATCFSVNTNPFQQWDQTFRVGLDFIVGYRGTSADSSTTDEVPRDFANSVFGNNSRFKSSWFSAAEDWWIDDVASVAAPGASQAEAISRRDTHRASDPRRVPNPITDALWVAWSWHEG